MVTTGRVYVPSAIEEGGAVVAMGCFSTQETAMNVLRSFLKKSHQVPLERASIAAWEVDVVGDDAVSVLSEFECRVCPVCHRTTFLLDAQRLKASCFGSACGAWIEESAIQPDVIDCGWPPTQLREQVETIDDAMRSLRRIAAKAEAAGTEPRTTPFQNELP